MSEPEEPMLQIVRGEFCVYWDFEENKHPPANIWGLYPPMDVPMCPYCQQHCATQSLDSWNQAIEAQGPEHVAFMEWLRGKHYDTYEIAMVAYQEELANNPPPEEPPPEEPPPEEPPPEEDPPTEP